MSRIRSNDTKPEIYLRKLLFADGFRYRLHDKRLPGKPDLYFPRYNAVVFIHGCFWHRHEGCRYATTPKTNQEYWNAKFKRNTERDKEQIQQLHSMKIRTAVVWECHIKEMMKSEKTKKELLDTLENWLKGKQISLEL